MGHYIICRRKIMPAPQGFLDFVTDQPYLVYGEANQLPGLTLLITPEQYANLQF